MPNGVGFRAFKTSSQRPVPGQPAKRASVTLRRPRHGCRISGTWQPGEVVRDHEGLARGEPPGKSHVAVQDQEERDAGDYPEEDLRLEHGDEDGRELHLAEPEPVRVDSHDLAGCAQEGQGGNAQDEPGETTDAHEAACLPGVHRRSVGAARRGRTESEITAVMVAARRGLGPAPAGASEASSRLRRTRLRCRWRGLSAPAFTIEVPRLA